ncbi:MAG: threonine--tRNA ligase [candidate division WOR-3 bacterium]|nr:MAG: threonine--tRNA ligase [candidate division WOR-3 bacterium]
MIKIRLNGKTVEIERGKRISDQVKDRKYIAARINGELVDMATKITEDSSLELVDFSCDDGKKIYWHSSSHVMAMAVKKLFPEAKLAIGPAIDQGFYYDFDTKTPFSTDDLTRIEAEMRRIIEQDIPFERVEMEKQAAIDLFDGTSESFKVQLIEGLDDENISIYRNGDFADLCRGPHVPSTGYIRSFKLLSVAGAYWRGDVNEVMLSRIYGISFPEVDELNDFLEKVEEAKKRDHRKLGTELELFSIFEEAGAGLVYWHPKGAVLRRIIEDYWIQEHLAAGYKINITPHIARGQLWQKSGHYDFYIDNMYVMPVENEEYVLKPMNCPGHILIYKSRVRSYRELPIKYAELGTVYRKELSGTLHGLLRVRGITIDDAHIFCQPEQIDDEIVKVLELTKKFMNHFGFYDFRVELSVRDPKEKTKYMGTDEEWERAERGLVNALDRIGFSYTRMEGEAVFYGPKIDIKLVDALDRKWQAATVQFDFNLPRRFDIEYMDKDGQHKKVMVIHRAIYGSLERFIGCLIEHYAGSFPVWLAPVQVVVMPITDKENKYAESILKKCRKAGLRAELNNKSEKINYRIREVEVSKVPYMLILGQREVVDKVVSVRKHKEGNLGQMKLKDLFHLIESEQGGAN